MAAQSLSGRTAVVTGAASGLGRATAVVLSAVGVRVVICDIDEVGAIETLRLVTELGGRGTVEVFDVVDDNDRRRLIDGLRHSDSAFTILINVAGIDRPGYLHDLGLSDFRRVNGVNYEGPVMLMSEFIKHFRSGSSGPRAEVVNVLSISAITVGSGALAYNSSKAAFAKATEVAQRDALEWGYHCRIQGIMPAAMDTPMMHQWGLPRERMMAPEVVADEILHCLLRPPSAYGQNLIITPMTEPDWPR